MWFLEAMGCIFIGCIFFKVLFTNDKIEKAKNNFINNKGIYIVTILFIITVFGLFSLQIIIDCEESKSNVFKFNFGTINRLLTNFGAIIGAMIGLLGVNITLNYNEKQNFKNKQLEYKPFVKIDSDYQEANKLSFISENVVLIEKKITPIKREGFGFTFDIEIKNFGLGDANDIAIRGDAQSVNTTLHLAKGESTKIKVVIKDVPDKIGSCYFSIKYKDFLNNEYQNEYSLTYKLNTSKNDNFYNDKLEIKGIDLNKIS